MKRGAVSVSQPEGHVSYFQMRKTSTGRPTTKSTSGTLTPPSGSSVRGKYTFVTSGRFDSRLRLARLSAEAKYCIGQHTRDDEAGVRGRARGEVRELPEDDHVDERRERRHEDRPRDAEEGLLVADGDVAPDERPEELAVVPQLADVEARNPARRPDHRDAAGSLGVWCPRLAR